MSHDTRLDAFVAKLTDRTQSENLVWAARDGGYELTLQNGVTVLLGARTEGPQPTYTLNVLSPEGVPVAIMTATGSDSRSYGNLARLHEAVGAPFRNQVLDDALAVLDRADAQVVRSPRVAPPKRPTGDDEQALFRALAGMWQLDYSRGAEVCRIGDDGVYSYVRRGDLTPKFRLKLVALNEADKRIELAKDYLDSGQRFQTEVLDLDDLHHPKRMDGVAKHDSHGLRYTRS